MVGREESSSKCRGLCINRGGYLIPRSDNFEEKLLNDYLISSDLIIHRVVLQKFGSIIGNNRSFGIYAHTIGQEMNRFGNLVRGIFGTDPIQTKMNSLESSFIFDNHAFRKLGWNANDLLNATDKIKASFLMGCFDSEGCVFKDKSGLAWYNTNYNLTILINKLLKSLNIYPTIIVRKLSGIGNFKTNKYYYTLSVYKKESIINFYKYIRFSIQRKQERLIKQIDSIKIRMEVQQMEDEISEKVIEKQREDRDNHTVFIGLKPFMKSI